MIKSLFLLLRQNSTKFAKFIFYNNFGDEMTLFDNILLQIILVLFPLSIWMIYQIYAKNVERKRKDITFDIALITMLYLMIKLIKNMNYLLYFTFSIPLLLAYIKKREISFLIIGFINVIYFYMNFHTALWLLCMEYIFCYLLYKLLQYRKDDFSNDIKIFICSKTLFVYCYLTMNSFVHYESFLDLFLVFLLLFVYYFISFFTMILLKKTEDIILYSNAVSLLEEEKRLRTSLFKITHEIKNPIAVCKGYLDMFDVNNLEHSKKYIPILKEEVFKVLTLLQDFLSIRKIKIEKETLDIYYLLETIEGSIKPLIKENGIEFYFHVPDEELYIDGDYNRLNQVIINILKNSIEAMKETNIKKLNVHTKLFKDKVNIYIEDSGVGISEENLNKMKEPFFSTKRSGTGLGVYLSREILKEHDGTLNYESKEGIGTKVTITLPIKKDILFS